MTTSHQSKSLYRWTVARHFIMESIRTENGLLIPRDWLVKLDLKDVYLSVPIHKIRKSCDFIGRAGSGSSRPSPLG